MTSCRNEEARAAEHGRHWSLEVRGGRWGRLLESHHGDGRLALNVQAPRGSARALPARAPEMFHVPKYVGHRGWIGRWLDLPEVDGPAVEASLEEACRMAAPESRRARAGRPRQGEGDLVASGRRAPPHGAEGSPRGTAP